MGIINYFKETKAEMRHVAWPTREQTVVYTSLVILLSAILAMYVGFFDFLFTRALETFFESAVSPTTQVAPAAPTTTEPVNLELAPGMDVTPLGN